MLSAPLDKLIEFLVADHLVTYAIRAVDSEPARTEGDGDANEIQRKEENDTNENIRFYSGLQIWNPDIAIVRNHDRVPNFGGLVLGCIEAHF